jgi:histidinol-phosphate phosphatase family protein
MKKILIIRFGAIGDVILSSAAVINLKLSFPDSKIYFLTRPRTAVLLPLFAGMDEILEFPRKASAKDLYRMGEYLDNLKFDIVVDLHGNIRSKYLMHHVTAAVKVQYDKRRWERMQAVYRKKINPNPPHTIDLYNSAIKKCGGRVYATRPSFRINKTGKLFDNDRPTIAFAPGASFEVKKWPAERFIELIREVYHQLQANIVLLLTKHDKDFIGLDSEYAADRLKTYIDAELPSLAEVVAGSDLIISNDSAMAHLGSAVGTPVMAIFGPTHPTLGFAPAGLYDSVIQTDEFCRPCSLHGRKKCYRDRQYCFEKISVGEVLEKIRTSIDEFSHRNRALFIDRDGTLIKEKNFIDNPDEVEPEENSIEAIKLARQAGFKIIILSNQSGVARGYFTEETVRQINQRVQRIFELNDAPVDDMLYCPHYPHGKVKEYSIECICRKPAPGLVEKACRRFNINPFASYVIGDKRSDINLAYVTGARAVMVQTGYGIGEEKKMTETNSFHPETVAQNLYEAVKYITETEKSGE